MTADIQAILQLLQRQTAAVPPAYSTVTCSPEYQSRVQPAIQTETSLDTAPPPTQSLDSETSPIKSKDPPPAFLHTQTLPDGNFRLDSESDADQRQTLLSDDVPEQQQALRFHSGRQASLPDVPNSSGPLGLHRPVSDPGLPGQ
ncbi:potassium voltage-gated channel subfamily H member 7 [Austrofundulus limnaeus]|nr:PREDICTED: potassium voltage-gated channel subfamily H member 7-like [Austrofundulus limnaeus]